MYDDADIESSSTSLASYGTPPEVVVSTTTRGSSVMACCVGEWRVKLGELRVDADDVDRCDGSSLMVDREISDMIGCKKIKK